MESRARSIKGIDEMHARSIKGIDRASARAGSASASASASASRGVRCAGERGARRAAKVRGMRRVVCVAEKPSLAHAIARALANDDGGEGDGSLRTRRGGATDVHEFTRPFDGLGARGEAGGWTRGEALGNRGERM
jgi:hypothetical protein